MGKGCRSTDCTEDVQPVDALFSCQKALDCLPLGSTSPSAALSVRRISGSCCGRIRIRLCC